MKSRQEISIGVAALILIAIIAFWWMSARQPVGEMISTTAAEIASSTPISQPNGGKPTVSITKVPRSAQTVNTIVAGLSTGTRFNSLYKSTGVSAMVSSTGKYTIFVPSNGAFAQLPGSIISSMTTAEKKRLIEYHVVSGRSVDVDAELAGTIQALSGDALNFNYGPDKVPMVNSAIVITEYTGKNGTVYLVDNVLLPPKKANGAI